MTAKIEGLIAATHTPMHDDGELNLGRVEDQARHLAAAGVKGVFVGGTTGESLSLSVAERCALSEGWVRATAGTDLLVIVHAGHNSLPEARTLAAHAQEIGAHAVAAMAPCYFKPGTVADLVMFMSEVAGSAPSLPFYFYDLPALTGVSLPMEAFLTLGKDEIPTLRGIKYTNMNLSEFQKCVQFDGGRFDILFGVDEALLAGLSLGAKGAVGSTYNFAAPLYLRILRAFRAGDLETARAEQLKAVKLVDLLMGYDFPPAAKAVMALIGVDCGPVRPPLVPLTQERRAELETNLETLGFFEWIREGKEEQ